MASSRDGPTLALTEWTLKNGEAGVEASVQPKVSFGSPVRGRAEQSSGDVSSMAFWGCMAAIVTNPNAACSDCKPRIASSKILAPFAPGFAGEKGWG
ncbi:hypothetical protein SH467x_001056 [Pirellulaceae bacterium SH467]